MKYTPLVIRVRLSTGALDALGIELPHAPPWKLIASGLGIYRHEFEGDDLSEALIKLRKELDAMGCRLLCNGARVDVFPSGMSRSMGGGRRAYITSLGEPATTTVDIFGEADPNSVGTVEQQKEFHTRWVHSLMNGR